MLDAKTDGRQRGKQGQCGREPPAETRSCHVQRDLARGDDAEQQERDRLKHAGKNHDAHCSKPVTKIAGHGSVSYTHLRAHETRHDLVCRLLLEKKKKKKQKNQKHIADKTKTKKKKTQKQKQ